MKHRHKQQAEFRHFHWIIVISLLSCLGSQCLATNRPRISPDADSFSTEGVPKLIGRVNDYAGLLASHQIEELSRISADLEKETGAQMVILVVPTTAPYSIEEYSLRVMNGWGIGRKEYNDGSAIVLAVKDRAARIELGYGTNRFFTDDMARTIMQEYMIPRFRNVQYYEGLRAGATEMAQTIRQHTPESWRP